MDSKVDEVKFVVNEMNNALNKKLTLVAYDALKDNQRIDLLLEVFKHIDPQFKVDEMDASDPEDIVIKVLEMLRIFKYQPPGHVDSESFRNGILTCDKSLLNHIFHYLLSKRNDLKKRAYLARYLVRVEVSPEVEGDNDVVTLFQQYDKLMESFKQIHSVNENLKKNVKSVQELTKDIRSMESEKEQLLVKLSDVKRKTDLSVHGQLYDKVKAFREEKDKNEKLIQQNVKQINQLEELKSKLRQLNNQLSESSATIDPSADDPQILIEKLSEELKTKKALMTDVLPREISQLDQYIANLHELESSSSAISSGTLEKLKSQASRLAKEVNSIMEKKMLRQEQSDDRMRIFKQNAQEITAKRIFTEKKLTDSEGELHQLQKTLEEKKMKNEGREVFKGDALKQYVNVVKGKGNRFKKSKTELNEIRTERGILARSLDILQAKERELNEMLCAIEEEKGILGYFAMKEDLKKNREVAGESSARSSSEAFTASDSMSQVTADTLEELTSVTKKLSDTIAMKKAKLAPIIQDLRPLRQTANDLQQEVDAKKSTYDTTAATLESNLSKLESEVKRLSDEKESLESQDFKLKCDLEVVTGYEQLMETETQFDNDEETNASKRGFIADLEARCRELRQVQENLKNQQRYLKENEDTMRRQIKLWKDLQVLFEIKRLCIERRGPPSAPQAEQDNEKNNRLVL